MAIRAPRLTFLALYHYILQHLIKYRYNSIEHSGVEYSGVEYSGVEYSGVEYSGIAKDQRYNAKNKGPGARIVVQGRPGSKAPQEI